MEGTEAVLSIRDILTKATHSCFQAWTLTRLRQQCPTTASWATWTRCPGDPSRRWGGGGRGRADGGRTEFGKG